MTANEARRAGADVADAVREVARRLRRESALGGEVVDSVVEEAAASFRGARVTVFLPLLVERRARARIRELQHRPLTP